MWIVSRYNLKKINCREKVWCVLDCFIWFLYYFWWTGDFVWRSWIVFENKTKKHSWLNKRQTTYRKWKSFSSEPWGKSLKVFQSIIGVLWDRERRKTPEMERAIEISPKIHQVLVNITTEGIQEINNLESMERFTISAACSNEISANLDCGNLILLKWVWRLFFVAGSCSKDKWVETERKYHFIE